MRRLGLLLFAIPFSTVAQAQSPFSQGNLNSAQIEAQTKAYGCSALMTSALNSGMGMMGNGGMPISIDGDKTNVLNQDSIVSRDTQGDTETIEYKAQEIARFDDGKPVYETVRKTVVVKRSNGKVVSILHPLNVKKQAEARAAFEKKYKSTGMKFPYMKSFETTFKENTDGSCETDQKQMVTVKDESGKDKDVIVTYDAALCDKLQPAIAQVGKNNAAQCGSLLQAVDSAYKERSKELKANGKKLGAGMDAVGSGYGITSASMTIANCLTEQAMGAGGSGMGYGYGMGYGFGMGSIAPGAAVDMGMGTPYSGKITSGSNNKKSDSTKKSDSNPGNR